MDDVDLYTGNLVAKKFNDGGYTSLNISLVYFTVILPYKKEIKDTRDFLAKEKVDYDKSFLNLDKINMSEIDLF